MCAISARSPVVSSETVGIFRICGAGPAAPGGGPLAYGSVQRCVGHDKAGGRRLSRAATVLEIGQRYSQIVYEGPLFLAVKMAREWKDSWVAGLQIERHPFREPMVIGRFRIDLSHVTLLLNHRCRGIDFEREKLSSHEEEPTFCLYFDADSSASGNGFR
jgi:hypothetical protein